MQPGVGKRIVNVLLGILAVVAIWGLGFYVCLTWGGLPTPDGALAVILIALLAAAVGAFISCMGFLAAFGIGYLCLSLYRYVVYGTTSTSLIENQKRQKEEEKRQEKLRAEREAVQLARQKEEEERKRMSDPHYVTALQELNEEIKPAL